MGGVTADVPEAEDALPRMTLGEHLDELRRRVVRSVLVLGLGIVVAFVFHAEIFRFVRRPYDEAIAQSGAIGKLQGLGPLDGFMASMTLAFLAALVATSPFVLAQLWGFVSAGLYPKERRVVRIFFPVSVSLFALGCAFAYLIVLPIGMRFLMGWNVGVDVGNSFGVRQYLGLCLSLVFGLGLAFELPLAILFLEATGIVPRAAFARHWRMAVLVAFVLAMVLTPDTSPVSMTLVAVPLVALYFLGVWGGRFVGEGKQRFRVVHAWPLFLLLLGIGALFWFRAEITAWAARVFS
jgi:sec-independent protein translocase protein TatC